MARARGFNLTAEINLRGPANIRTVVADIRRQLGSIDVNINPRISPNTARTINTLNNALTNLNRTLATTQVNVNNAANAIGNLGRAIGNIGGANIQALNNAANACQTINQNANRAAQNLGGAATQMEEFGRQSALAVRRFAAFSIVTSAINSFIGAISSGIRTFIEFDREFVRLQQVTGESARGLQGLSNQITELSTSLGVASTDLTTVAVTLAQAGLSSRDTAKALQALAKSALAPSFDDLNQTVEGSIALMRQFGIGAGDLETALGSVNAVAAQFAVEASDLITAIQRTGGVFATSSKGVSEGTQALNEFLAIFTSVRATTRESAETIATGLRTIFTRIQRGGTIEALKEYGVVLTDLEGKFVGPFEAVRRLSEGLSQLDPRDVRFSQIIEELGGFRQIGKVIPLIQQFATAQQALNVAQAGGASLAKDAATAQLSIANQIAKVREEFLALIKSIGESESFRAFIRLSLDLASALIKVADSAKVLLPAITALAAVRGVSALTQFGFGFAGGIGGGRRRGFASGGMVPGTGSGDTVPAMLTPGEFVIRKKAVQAIGVSNLHGLNRYADGGIVQKFQQTVPTPGSGLVRTLTGAEILEQRRRQRKAALAEAKTSGTIKRSKNKSEGFPFALAALFGAPYRKTLKGPQSKETITLIGGALPSTEADKYQNLGLAGFKKTISDVGKSFASSIGASVETDDNKLNKIIQNTGLGNIIGSILEASLGVAGSPFVDKTRESASIDFPAGLGPLATKFGLPTGIPTDATRTIESKGLRGKTVGDFLGQADRFLLKNQYSPLPGRFASGGSVSDTVPALLTPGEFVINKKAASRLGSGTLNRLNKADKIQGYNKGGFVDGVQKFADGGSVLNASNLSLAIGAISGIAAIFVSWNRILPSITQGLTTLSTSLRTTNQGLTAPTATARSLRAQGLRGQAFRGAMGARGAAGAGLTAGLGATFVASQALPMVSSLFGEELGRTINTIGQGAIGGAGLGASLASMIAPYFGTAAPLVMGIGTLAGGVFGLISGISENSAQREAETKAREKEALRPEQILTQATAKIAQVAENWSDIFRAVTNSVERFGVNLEETSAAINNASDILEGKFSPKISRISETLVKSPNLASVGEIQNIGRRIETLSGGSEVGRNISSTIVAGKIIQDVLPQLLRSTDLTQAENIVPELRKTIEAQTGQRVSGPIFEVLRQVESSLQGVDERQRDSFDEIADKIVSDSASQVSKVVESAYGAATPIISRYLDSLDLLSNTQAQYAQKIAAINELAIKSQETRVAAELDLRKAIGTPLSLAELNAPQETRVRGLTQGLVPGGTTNPAQIAQSVLGLAQQSQALSARREELAQISEPTQAMIAEFYSINDALNANNIAIQNGTKALEELGNSGTSASNVLSRLAERQQRSRAVGSLIDRLITGGAEERIKITRQSQVFAAGRAALAAGQGQQFFANETLLQEFTQSLQAFEGTLDPKILSEIKRQFYTTILPPGMDLSGLAAGATTETLIGDLSNTISAMDPLVKEYNLAITNQINAQNSLGTILSDGAFKLQSAAVAIAQSIPPQFQQAINVVPPVNQSRGGLIYASKGAYVHYQPKGTDTVPAMLSPGEFVVNARSTSKNLPLLKAINRQRGGLTYASQNTGILPNYKPVADRVPGMGSDYWRNLGRVWNPFNWTKTENTEADLDPTNRTLTGIARAGVGTAIVAGTAAGIGVAAGAGTAGSTGVTSGGSVLAYPGFITSSAADVASTFGAAYPVAAAGTSTTTILGAGAAIGVGSALPSAMQGYTNYVSTPNRITTLSPATYRPTETQQAEATTIAQPTTQQITTGSTTQRQLSTNSQQVPDFYEMIRNTQIYGTPYPSQAQLEIGNIYNPVTPAQQQRIAEADNSMPVRRETSRPLKPLSRRQQMLANRRSAYQAMMASRRAKFAAANPNYRRARVRNNIYSATGGLINRGSDSIPAMLTPGEFVVNRQATSENLPLLHAMNGGKVGYYQNGGMVGGANTGPNSGSIVLDPQAKSTMTTFMDTLSSFGNSFGSYIDRLSAIKIPDKIEMVGTHTVEVNVTGAAAFEAIEAGVKNLINTEISKKMETIWNQSGGKLGEPALLNKANGNTPNMAGGA